MTIYKYIDIDGAKKMAENKSVVLKCPTEYNDPFDSVFKVDEKEKEKAFKLFLNYQLFKEFYSLFFLQNKKPDKNKLYGKILKENVKQISISVKRTGIYKTQPDLAMYYALASKILKKNDKNLKSQFNKMIDGVLDTMRDRVILSCFGSTYDSVLMWSHYAEKHNGICVEYEVDNPDYRRVSYEKEIPIFQLTKVLEIIFGHEVAGKEVDTNDSSFWFALDPIVTKLEKWEYEGEVRIMFSKNKEDPRISNRGSLKLFLMPEPKRIFMGCKSSSELEDTIIKAFPKTKVIRMKMSNDSKGKVVIA